MPESSEVDAFLKQYRADLDSGQERDLDDYLTLFPNDPEGVSIAHRSLIDGSTIFTAQDESDRAETLNMGALPITPSPTIKKLGQYHIVKQIGRGGQGLVFLAKDERLGRLVALKVMHGLSMQSPDNLQRFRREAEAVSQLDDPGICTVFETGTIEGVPFIAMQYVDGRSLSELLKADILKFKEKNVDGTIADAKSQASHSSVRARVDYYVSLVERVARSLATAHEKNLVHRDIKPGNIMVGKDDRPIILDFGLAHVDNDDGLTNTGDVLGTPAYMAPEQIRGELQRIDIRTDIYALGVTLFECVTMERPFSGPTRQALYRQIIEGRLVSASTYVPNIRRDLDIILRTAMDADMNRRYQSADAFADDLARFLRRETIQARPASWSLILSRWAERNPALAVSLAISFLSLLTGLILTTSLWRQSDLDRQKAERETRRADTKAQEAKENLDSYEMLSDSLRYSHFLQEMPSFYPPHPERIPLLDKWLNDVEELLQREPLYRALLQQLQEESHALEFAEIAQQRHAPDVKIINGIRERLIVINEALAEDLPAEQRTSYEAMQKRVKILLQEMERATLAQFEHVFSDADKEWRHDNIKQLIDNIELLKEKSDPLAPVAAMLRLKSQCQRIQQESLIDASQIWDEAIKSIGDQDDCPLYQGLVIEPQLGLVPIGKDSKSGLWEFAHVLTGSMPERSEDGELILKPDFATILVLLPGGRHTIGARKPSFEGETGPHIDFFASGLEYEPRVVDLHPFFVGKHEFTLSQWGIGTGDELRSMPGEHEVTEAEFHAAGRQPLSRANWYTAERFTQQLGFDLPTEAQWEYACRGGTTTTWWCGSTPNTLAGIANINDAEARRIGLNKWNDGFERLAPADSFEPNPFGLHHIYGNVWEVTRDDLVLDATGFSPGDGLHSITIEEDVVIRGGGSQNAPVRCTSASRAQVAKESSASTIGIRVCRKVYGLWRRP
ncbi:MAG: serine/threonine protein kinase/formylglycine-generating enzyme required for sulfatase activity [Planctomycetota bacterium]|jgi:serine/threonine protein kinase/formylglycine-generating enzyme required for sulfatase activity